MSPAAPRRGRPGRSAAVAFALFAFAAAGLSAQELAPRAYWPAPVGTRILGIGYGYSTGEVLVDPALPVDDLDANTSTWSASYATYFDLAGRTASFQVDVPWADTRFSGRVEGEATTVELSGWADVKARLAVNLIGAPAMNREQFRAFRQDPGGLLGASLRVQAPTGDYNPDRVANIGTSRWAVKPEVGYLYKLSPRWTLDAALGLWIYGENSDFLEQQLEQRPLLSAEIHLVRRIRRSFWASVDLNGFIGGRTTVDGELKDNRQENSRVGLTLAFPAVERYVVKLAWSTGLTTEIGGDFDAAVIAVQRVWN
jgi:hypothetical protein